MVSLLQIMSGAWISILQVHRRMLCFLDHLYQAQQGRSQESVIAVSGEAKSEIWSLCALGGIADLRAQSHKELFLSDASEEFTASVKVDISKELSSELQPRGAWSKLLTPWQSWLKAHGKLWEEDELPAGIPLVSDPLWLELAESLQFRLHHRQPCRSKNI